MKLKEALSNVGISGISVKGEILNVYPYKTGTGEHGDYSYQNIVIKDDTAQATVNLSCKDEITKSTVGEQVEFNSQINPKKGLKTGVKVVENHWTDKEGQKRTSVQIKVTQNAEVSFPLQPISKEPTAWRPKNPVKEPLNLIKKVIESEQTNTPMPFIGGRTPDDYPIPNPNVQDLQEKINSLPNPQMKENILKIFDQMLVAIKDTRQEISEL